MSSNFDPAVLNDARVQEEIKGVARDISDQWTKMESMRTYVSEALKGLSDNTGVPKNVLRELARTYHRNSFQSEMDSVEIFTEAYQQVFGIEE